MIQKKIEPFKKTDNPHGPGIHYKVHGFWSDRFVEVWITESLNRAPDQIERSAPDQIERSASINWSCGGRSQEEEPDDIVATGCLAAALTDACEEAKRINQKNKEGDDE